MAEKVSGGTSEKTQILLADKGSRAPEQSSSNGTFAPLPSQREGTNGTDNKGFRVLGTDRAATRTSGFVALSAASLGREHRPHETAQPDGSVDTTNSEKVAGGHEVFSSQDSGTTVTTSDARSENVFATPATASSEGLITRDSIFDFRTTFIKTHLDRVRGRLPSTGLAVDLGCCAGMGTIALAKSNWGAIGIDIDFSGNEIPYAAQRASDEGLKTALVKGGSELVIPQRSELLFVQGDAKVSLLAPDNTADLVTSFFTAGPLGVDEDPWKKFMVKGHVS